MIRIAIVAAALALAACAPAVQSTGTPPDMVEQASVTIEKVEGIYAAAKPLVQLVLPLLPEDKVRLYLMLDERFRMAITAAKAAVSIADQVKALKEAEDAAQGIQAIATGA